MKQIIYSMQFKGQAALVAGSTTVLKAATRAPSCTVTTVVGPEGVSETWKQAAGGKASFESESDYHRRGLFVESGSIRFGEGNHLLRFSTVGQGYLGASPDPKLKTDPSCGGWMVAKGSLRRPAVSLLRTS